MPFSPSDQDTLFMLLLRVREAVQRQYGLRLVRVRLETADEKDPIIMPIPPVTVVVPAEAVKAEASAVKLNDADLTILQAIMELGESPTGADIAKAAGYTYDSHIKAKLHRLRHYGFLGGAKGETGYPLTDAAYDALGGKD